MKPDIKSLQGTWNIVSLEIEGQNMPCGEASITLEGTRFTTTAMGGEYSGTLEVDETASPKSFNLVFEAGSEGGNTSYGIYELDGDTWRICLTLHGGTRPKKFATKAGSGLALETLQRAGTGKAQANGNKKTKASAKGKAKAEGSAKDKAPGAGPIGEPAPELAGEWSMVSAIMSGNPLDPEYVKVGRRIATEGELQVHIGTQTVMKAAYAVDRAKSPKQMDYRLADGRTQAGIWSLEGTQLKTCFGAPGQPRPTELASTAGDGRTFSVWTRATK